MKIDVSTVIDSPVEKVWRFMTDLSNLAKLNPSVHELKQISTGPIGVGTTFNAIQEGNQVTTIRVIEYEPNQKLSLEHTSGPTKGTKTNFIMEAVEGKTRLTCATNIQLNGFYRLIGPFVAGRARKEIIYELDRERRSIEAQT